jgi:hypothetical protein
MCIYTYICVCVCAHTWAHVYVCVYLCVKQKREEIFTYERKMFNNDAVFVFWETTFMLLNNWWKNTLPDPGGTYQKPQITKTTANTYTHTHKGSPGLRIILPSQAVVAHAFSPSIWKAETGGFLSLMPAWSTEWVPRQPGLYRETLSQNNNNNNKNNNKTHTHK